MGETEWALFCSSIGTDARNRLLVIFEHFCDDGEADLPSRAFGWLASDPDVPGGSRQGAFEAHGVVVRGRQGTIDKEKIFYVTEISMDPPQPATRGRIRADDRRQGRLPFPRNPSERN